METPTTDRRLRRHVPTPKMSERKKSLFKQNSSTSEILSEDSDLGPMSPLEFSSSPTRYETSEFNRDRMKNDVKTSNKNDQRRISFKNIIKEFQIVIRKCDSDEEISNRKILSDVTSKITPIDNVISLCNNADEIHLKTPSEATTNNDVPKISFRKSLIDKGQTPSYNENISPNTKKILYKRNRDQTTELQTSINNDSGDSPKIKIQKLIDNNNKFMDNPKARTSLTFDTFKISTKSFYPKATSTEPYQITKKHNNNDSCTEIKNKNNFKKQKENRNTQRQLMRLDRKNFAINKGVRHGIIKRKMNKTKILRNKLISKRLLEISINTFRKSKLIKNEESNYEDDTKITPDQIQRMNRILKTIKHPNPNKLNILNDDEFTDDDDEDESSDDEKINNDNNDQKKEKKFFKSKNSSVKNKYRMLGNIAATMTNGKLSLIPDKKKRRRLPFFSDETDFTADSKEVNDILNKLQNRDEDEINNLIEIDQEQLNLTNEDENNIAKYYNMLPYNTTDPNIIERQKNLLEFLIVNNICTEENFKIFIKEPEKYKNEASAIVDQFIIISDELTTYEQYIDVEQSQQQQFQPDNSIQIQDLNNINDVPMSPTSQISNMTSELVLECNVEENTDNTKTFPIFQKGFAQRSTVFTDQNLKKDEYKKTIWHPIGNNQYQIDAGQKKFGATECADCGLVYSLHEPEDELMHLNFHNKSQVLKFKGWSEEKVITEILEWGIVGRIISVSINDSKTKLNRIMQILKMVDNELGFAEIHLDKNCLIYLAIGKNVIMGICVAQPQTRGYKFIDSPGTDLCTEESYPIKCGISRIWVAEPFRRQGVAKHLVNAVRSSFIFGHWLTYDELAFGSPTDTGKLFAKKLTQRSDFLVYI